VWARWIATEGHERAGSLGGCAWFDVFMDFMDHCLHGSPCALMSWRHLWQDRAQCASQCAPSTLLVLVVLPVHHTPQCSWRGTSPLNSLLAWDSASTSQGLHEQACLLSPLPGPCLGGCLPKRSSEDSTYQHYSQHSTRNAFPSAPDSTPPISTPSCACQRALFRAARGERWIQRQH
jgi:hypothetical protein